MESDYTLPTISAANLSADMFNESAFDFSNLRPANQDDESPHFSPVDVDRALKLARPVCQTQTPKSTEKRSRLGSDIRNGVSFVSVENDLTIGSVLPICPHEHRWYLFALVVFLSSWPRLLSFEIFQISEMFNRYYGS